MGRKLFKLLLPFTAICLLLSACGGTNTGQQPSVQDGTAVPPATVEADDTNKTDDAASYAGTELTFLRHSGYDADWMAEMAVKFEAETGIKVTVEQVAYSEMHSKFVLDASTDGGMYDMFATTDYWLPEFYEGGWVIDQNQFLNNPALVSDTFNKEDIPQNIYDIDSMDGNLLALPWKFNTQFLFYRTDLLSKAPANWDEMLAAAESANKDGVAGVALALSKTSVMDIYLNFLYQNGGTFLNAENTECMLDSQQALEALEYLISLSSYASEGAINSHWDEVAAVFSQGGAAMAPLINTQAGNMSDEEKSSVIGKYGFSVLPGKVTSSAAASTWGICITANCEAPEAAFLYIEYLNRPENIKELVAATNGSTVPVRSSLLQDSSFQADYPHFNVMYTISSTPGYTYSYPKTAQSGAIMEVLATHVQEAFLGNKTPSEALAAAKSEVDALL